MTTISYPFLVAVHRRNRDCQFHNFDSIATALAKLNDFRSSRDRSIYRVELLMVVSVVAEGDFNGNHH